MNQNKQSSSLRLYLETKNRLDNFKIENFREKQSVDDKINYFLNTFENNKIWINKTLAEELIDLNLNIEWIPLTEPNLIIPHLIWFYKNKQNKDL